MIKRIALLLAILLAIGAVGASAQSLTGTIVGKVVDEQGGVLPGVTVNIPLRQENSAKRWTKFFTSHCQSRINVAG